MKSRLEIWRYWCKHTQNNILYKLLVLLKLRHSSSFEFLYIRETYEEKYGCSPFAGDHIDPRLIKRIFPSYKSKEEESLLNGKESSLADCITEEKIEEIAEASHGVTGMYALPEEQRKYIQSLIDRAANGDVFVQILLRRWKNKKYDEKDQIAHPIFFELPEEAKEVLYEAILDLKKERDYAAWVRKD